MTFSNFVRHNPTQKVIRCTSPDVAQQIALQLNLIESHKAGRCKALWYQVANPHWHR